MAVNVDPFDEVFGISEHFVRYVKPLDLSFEKAQSDELEKIRTFNFFETTSPISFEAYHNVTSFRNLLKYFCTSQKFCIRNFKLILLLTFNYLFFMFQLLFFPLLFNVITPLIHYNSSRLNTDSVSSTIQLGFSSSLVYTVCGLLWICGIPLGFIVQLAISHRQ